MGPLPLPAAPTALSAKLARLEYPDGAVVVQIPQVPPHLVDSTIARNKGYFAYPPQALLYLSATLRGCGLDTELADLNHTVLRAAHSQGSDPAQAWRDALDAALDRFTHPLVCVSYMFDPTFEQLEAICAHLRARWPRAVVAVGGVAATADPERVLAGSIVDFVFSNEGEAPLKAFLAFWRGEAGTEPHNLSFLLEPGGAVIQTAMRTGGAVDLDIRAEYDRISIADYHNVGSLNNFSRMRGTEVPFATVISRRGCRARCTFCSVRNFNGQSVRVRQLDGVVEEMEHLYYRHGIRHFDWLDDDLIYDRDQAVALFRAIAQRLPDITWAANNGLIASSTTAEVLEAMQDSNCIGFTVGLETGNAEMLHKVRKPATIPKFLAFADLSRQFPKMFYIVNFIIGLPTETVSQMLDSYSLAIRAGLDWNNFFTFQPLKNTDAWLAYGGMCDDKDKDDLRRAGSTMNFNPVRGGAFGGEIRAGTRVGWDVFDLDPASIPDPEQRKELWFTFNYTVNFLRMPALTTASEARLDNAVRWLRALGTAYADNPSIDCVRHFLERRKGVAPAELAERAEAARRKFAASPYWSERDRTFLFSALLEGEIPALDLRAQAFFDSAARG